MLFIFIFIFLLIVFSTYFKQLLPLKATGHVMIFCGDIKSGAHCKRAHSAPTQSRLAPSLTATVGLIYGS